MALNSRLLLPLRRASATILSARGRRSFSNASNVAPSSLSVLHQPAQPHGVLQRERGALAGVRTGGVRGVPDQERPLARPGRQGRDVERRRDHDVFGGFQQSRDRIVPAGVEVAQVPLQRILAHGAERRGIDAVRGLGAPPHHAVVRIGTAEAVAEEPALPECRLHALSDRDALDHRARHKTSEADQAGIEGGWAIRDDVRTHGGMHAVRADQEVAFGAGAVGKMRDNRLVGAIFDADEPLLEGEFDVLAPGLVHDSFVECRAAHVDRGLTEALLHVVVDRAEPGSGLRVEVE